jgi:phosphoglycerate-specific signal transduction histidine kinase
VALPLLPKLNSLPQALPLDGAVRIELEEGVPIFRASTSVQSRIEVLLTKQQEIPLTSEEEQELDRYEEMDDYLSFVNRTIRNLQHPSRLCAINR